MGRALKNEMEEKSKEFVELGAEVYAKVERSQLRRQSKACNINRFSVDGKRSNRSEPTCERRFPSAHSGLKLAANDPGVLASPGIINRFLGIHASSSIDGGASVGD
jgi:hypothetical protein